MIATPSGVLKVFIDTNIFVALKDKNDPTHQKAVKFLEYLEKKNNLCLYTSSDVIGETLTVIARKLGKKAALDFLKEFPKSGIFEIFINEKINFDARKLFGQIKIKNVSFIDCSSAVAIKSAKILYAFTFDKHFTLLGVKLIEDIAK